MKQDSSVIPLTSPFSSPVRRVSGLRRAGGVRRHLLGRGLSINDENRSLAYNYETLLDAVDHDNYEICRTLLNNGVLADPLEEGRPNSTTPLILAAQKGFQDILKLLLSHEINVNAKNKNEQTALHFAARRNDVACCQELLDADDIDVCTKDKQGDTPLHLAVKHNSIDVCNALLAHGSNILRCSNKKGHTPLHTAAIGGNGNILNILIENGADWSVRDKNGFWPLHYAAQKGHTDCCRILIQDSGDDELKQLRAKLRDGRTPLMLASKCGYHHCCNFMASADVSSSDRDGNRALHFAVKGDYDNTVSSLLSRGANPNAPNKEGNTPLHEAVSNKTSKCTKLCLENGGDLKLKNKMEQSVLHMAAVKCSDQNLEHLLTFTTVKEMIDKKDKKGFTALHYAVMKKSVTCCLLLVDKGASVDIITNNSMTPLHLAADACNSELCEIFLSQKAVQINQENDDKELPLHLAASRGSVQCCNILLRKGAMVSAQDSKGRTPVHLAAQKNHMECIQLLARKGALLRAKDNEDRTALHYAAEMGSLNCCRVLIHTAKSLIWEETKFNILPLDLAFLKKEDEVFRFMMQKLNKKNNQDDLEIRIHDYMHCAILEERVVAIEAIVESTWWKCAFQGHRGPCQNFTRLIEDYPHLAKKVLDKCYRAKKNFFDFTLIENDFYVLTDSKRKRKMNPFDSETGKLPKDALSFYKNDHIWCKQNVLTKMILKERQDLLLHPVTKAWILKRWNSYAQGLFILYLVVETIFAVVLSTQAGMSRNWTHQDIKKDLICSFPRCFHESDFDCKQNVTDDLIFGCPNSWNDKPQAPEINESTEALQDFGFDSGNITLTLCTSAIPSWTVADISLSVVLGILLLTYFSVEVNCMVMLKHSYWGLYCCLRWLRLLMTFIFIIPFTWCCQETGIKEDWQWLAGIIAVLLEWLLLLHGLNRLPFLSVFMPVTKDFLWSYLKVITYILALIVLFAFIFHLLLWNQQAFVNVPQAVVKTLVLMLGDYGYDDLFFGDNPVSYPITANVFFVIFITTISGFIINLVITKPDDVANSFRSRATLHRAAASVSWILTLDVCLPSFRRRYAVGTSEDIVMSVPFKWQKSFTTKMLMLSEDKEFQEIDSRDVLLEQNREILQTLLDLAKDQKNQIEELKYELKALRKAANVDTKSVPGAAKGYK